MAEQHTFLVSQCGRPLAMVEAVDEANALNRAKGLGHVLDFSPSLPITAALVSEPCEGVPSFKDAYFELLGFKR
jgi:hypothetical protein